MIGNVLVEGAAGAIPVAGDLFDVGWRESAVMLGVMTAMPSVSRARNSSLSARMRAVLAFMAELLIGCWERRPQ
jgi:hypothetical protein